MPEPPLCFVVMPFGTKPDGAGGTVDFDAVYRDLLAPAVEAANLEPLRADQELAGGLIHKPMFERLVLVDYVVADLTTANPNVFYEIGVRHAVRPASTVLVGADVARTPFDLAPARAFPYRLSAAGTPSEPAADGRTLTAALAKARAATGTPDSPVFQLVEGLPVPDIERLKTDVFRDNARYSVEAKRALAAARREGAAAVRQVEDGLGPLEDAEAGVLVDLLLSYRATSAWADMLRLVDAMPAPLQHTVLVRQQHGLALNRAGRRAEALEVLEALLGDTGPSSETYGLLGRVHKDLWDDERAGSVLKAFGHLERAIDAYRRGFEADWRDAYPGVNAVTLMEIREPGGTEQQALAPVVRYANTRRLAAGAADYWDHATRLELAVVARAPAEATAAAAAALAAVREPWEPESTARNLGLIRDARNAAGEVVAWADAIEAELRAAGAG